MDAGELVVDVIDISLRVALFAKYFSPSFQQIMSLGTRDHPY